jgi:GT2 family glycosyltransferase
MILVHSCFNEYPKSKKLLQLSIIIVNYNAQYFLEQCLASVVAAGKNLAAEIIVIDNHSTDNSRQWLEEKFKQVKFTWLQQNLGFGKACNIGGQQAQGEYLLFLNPDTIITPGALAHWLDVARSANHFGALGVKMIDGSGSYLPESKRGFPSPLAAMCKFTGIWQLFPRSAFFNHYYLGHLGEDLPHRIDVVSGACMLLTRHTYQLTAGFNERFFMYGEDIDLSKRVVLQGLYNYYCPSPVIIHFKGESTHKQTATYIRNFYGAMQVYAAIHLGGVAVFLTNVFMTLVKWVKLARLSQKHPPTTFFDSDQLHQLLIVSDLNYYLHAKPSLTRVFPNAAFTNISFDEVEGVISGNHAYVLYCPAPNQIERMIAAMQKAGTTVLNMVHLQETRAIVSSGSHATRGWAISISA